MSARVAFGPISISFHVPILVPPSLPIICFPHFRSLITFYIHDPNQSRFWPLLQRTPSTDVLRAKFLFFPISSLRFVYGTLEFNSLEAWRARAHYRKPRKPIHTWNHRFPSLAFSLPPLLFEASSGHAEGAATALRRRARRRNSSSSRSHLLCFIWWNKTRKKNRIKRKGKDLREVGSKGHIQTMKY